MSHLQDIQIIVTPDQLITSVSCMAENRENKLKYRKVSNTLASGIDVDPMFINYGFFSKPGPTALYIIVHNIKVI